MDVPSAKVHAVVLARQRPPKGYLLGKFLTLLVEHNDTHILSHVDLALVGRKITCQHANQRRLAATIRAEEPQPRLRRQQQRDILEQQFAAECLGEPLCREQLL